MRRLDASSLVALATTLVLLVAIASLLPGAGLASTDEGNKLIQVENLERTGGLAIAYPARELDPALEFFPDGGNHFFRTPRGVYSYHPFYFPLLARLPHQLFGAAGLRFWPIAGTLLSLVVLVGLLGRCGFRSHGGWLLGFVFCTPLVVYSVGFWEHSIALFLSTAALWLLLASAAPSAAILFAAGAMLGLSTLLREEGYLLVVAVVCGYVAVYRRGWRAAAFAGGWLAILTPAWIVQRRLFGHVLGLHGLFYDPGALQWLRGFDRTALGTLARRLDFGLLQFHPDPWRHVAIAAPYALCLVAGLALRPTTGRRLRLGLLAAVAAMSALSLVWLVSHPSPQILFLYTQSFFPALPVLAIALLAARHLATSAGREVRFAFFVAVLYVAGCVVNLNLDRLGLLWGPRVIIPVLPLLLVLVRAGWESLRAAGSPRATGLARGLLMALVAVSLGLQGFGLYVVRAMARSQDALVREIARRPGAIVVTDAFWVPEALAPVFFDRKILQVRSDAELHTLMIRLAASHADDFVYVAARYFQQISPTGAAELVRVANGGTKLVEPGAEHWELMLLDGRVR